MKVIVTGGGGFLGKAIVRQLLQKGKTVEVIGRHGYPELEKLGVNCHKINITDKDALIAACKGASAIYHVAAKASIWGKRKTFYNINVLGTRNIIEACWKNGIGKLIYTSSPSVIHDGGNQQNVDETAPYPVKYLADYPATKAEAEQEVIAVNGVDGLLTCSIRPHLIWGPEDTNLIPRLAARAKSGKIAQVGDGKNMVDMVYVDNAAEAHLLAEERLVEGSPVSGSCYFITQGKAVNCWGWINEILTGFGLPNVKRKISYSAALNIAAMLESSYKILGVTSEPRMTKFLASQLATTHTFNISKARKELGYSPRVSTADGMKRMFEAGL